MSRLLWRKDPNKGLDTGFEDWVPGSLSGPWHVDIEPGCRSQSRMDGWMGPGREVQAPEGGLGLGRLAMIDNHLSVLLISSTCLHWCLTSPKQLYVPLIQPFLVTSAACGIWAGHEGHRLWIQPAKYHQGGAALLASVPCCLKQRSHQLHNCNQTLETKAPSSDRSI